MHIRKILTKYMQRTIKKKVGGVLKPSLFASLSTENASTIQHQRKHLKLLSNVPVMGQEKSFSFPKMMMMMMMMSNDGLCDHILRSHFIQSRAYTEQKNALLKFHFVFPMLSPSCLLTWLFTLGILESGCVRTSLSSKAFFFSFSLSVMFSLIS